MTTKTFSRILSATICFFSTNLYSQDKLTGCIYGDCNNGVGQMVYDDGGNYIGEWVDGKRNGIGVLKSKDFWYWGQFTDNQSNGFGGIFFYDNKEIYLGEWNMNKKDGLFFLYKNKKWYETKFKNDEYVKNVDISGCISGDCENGEGVYQWSTGPRYIGGFKQGIKTGPAIYVSEWGWVYKCNFDRQANGYALVVMGSGDFYIGELKDGNQQGQGIMICDSQEKNVKYIKGRFENGIMVEGSIFFRNGDEYHGEVKDFKIPHGIGTMFYDDGSEAFGTWIDGALEVKKTVVKRVLEVSPE
jgi:hypothetical protein